MCRGLVISDLTTRPPLSVATSKYVMEKGQKKYQQRRTVTRSECGLRKAMKLDEDEEDFEADFQAFSKAFDEEDGNHYEFLALCVCGSKDGLLDVPTPAMENAGTAVPGKGQCCTKVLSFMCVS